MIQVKKDFPLLLHHEDLVYLDNAATTHKPVSVIEAIEKFYLNANANVHRGAHDLGDQATAAYKKARQTVADFIGVASSEIVFTSGTTHAINLVAEALIRHQLEQHTKQKVQQKVVITTRMEHHSNYLPWQQLKEHYGIKFATIPFDPITGRLDLIELDKLLEQYQGQILLVALSHVSNVLGTVNPVRRITEKVHNAGGYVLLDAAQSIAHVPINVHDLGIDFLAFSGHKIYGPMGTGALFVKQSGQSNLAPFMVGGGMIEEVNVNSYTPAEFPANMEAGTPNVAGAVGLAAALDYLSNIGWERIIDTESRVLAYAMQRLKKIDELKIIGPPEVDSRVGVISFTLEGIHPHDVAAFMNQNQVAMRAGHHCAQLLHKELDIPASSRLSIGIYNTPGDIDKAITAINKIIKKLG